MGILLESDSNPLGVIIIGAIIILVVLFRKTKNDQRKNNASVFVDGIKKKGYIISKCYSVSTKLIIVDEKNECFLFYDADLHNYTKLNFDNILGMKIIEDGQSTTGVGRAVVGGVLFGDVGAVVGALTGKPKIERLDLVIYKDNISKPEYTFNLINKTTKKNTDLYNESIKCARSVENTVRVILNKRNDK